jgi:hypothetical protein
MDEAGYAHAIWYIVSGNITIGYKDNEPILSGECTSYFGSTISFVYTPGTQGLESIQPSAISIQKVIRDGQLYLMYEGKIYDVQGRLVK